MANEKDLTEGDFKQLNETIQRMAAQLLYNELRIDALEDFCAKQGFRMKSPEDWDNIDEIERTHWDALIADPSD